MKRRNFLGALLAIPVAASIGLTSKFKDSVYLGGVEQDTGLLDDYEYGEFNPVNGGTARYERVGNTVYIFRMTEEE